MMPEPTPITVITGFLGSGKTTIILNFISQLPKSYKLALLKNEFGDVAIDSQLATSASISGVQEILNGCICCNLVGQLEDALETLRRDVEPDRIVIETSGSAFPATLALEVNRLAQKTSQYVLDGVISVIDVVNWQGYEDTSVTAKMQAKFTDLIVFNKWELVDERNYDICLDRVGDLDVQVAQVKSAKGKVSVDLLLGFDTSLAYNLDAASADHEHDHGNDHKSEVEVLSVTLSSSQQGDSINLNAFHDFLDGVPKDEVYRVKAIFTASKAPIMPGDEHPVSVSLSGKYILNWAFGRWTYTPLAAATAKNNSSQSTDGLEADHEGSVLRMTIITARGEASKWLRKVESADFVKTGSFGRELVLSMKKQ